MLFFIPLAINEGTLPYAGAYIRLKGGLNGEQATNAPSRKPSSRPLFEKWRLNNCKTSPPADFA